MVVLSVKQGLTAVSEARGQTMVSKGKDLTCSVRVGKGSSWDSLGNCLVGNDSVLDLSF